MIFTLSPAPPQRFNRWRDTLAPRSSLQSIRRTTNSLYLFPLYMLLQMSGPVGVKFFAHIRICISE